MSLRNKRIMWALPVALLMLTGATGAGRVSSAQAQAAPPTRVYGTATIDGAAAPPGTLIEAIVNGATCGSDRLVGSSYVIDVEAAVKNPWCAGPGATVSLTIGGVPARETATYQTGLFIRLDLSRAPVPLFDPDAERPRTQVVGRGGWVEFKIHPEDDNELPVRIFSEFRHGAALAALYPATPSGAARLYIAVESAYSIFTTPGFNDHCTYVVGYSNIVVCSVTPGAAVEFRAPGE
jgi:hypothetical protein